jgi:hypothetical protein
MIMWQGKGMLIIKGRRLILIIRVKIKMRKIGRKVHRRRNRNKGTVQGGSRGARLKGRSSGARGGGIGWLGMRRKVAVGMRLL